MISRRRFLEGAAMVSAASALQPWQTVKALAQAGNLPDPSHAPFDHVVVVMMENRSFDHFLGWLPGANGKQEGLSYLDTSTPSKRYPTYQLAPDYQGCGYGDPNHSWQGGLKQLNGGKVDGFLQTSAPDDTFPVGYYTEESVPVLGALARNYTVSDNYFCAILAETYPNRFYQHAAATDRDTNGGGPTTSTLPTIWDRLKTAGLSGGYYSVDAPFTLLWGTAHLDITRPFPAFLADCAAGQLPNVSFVDPKFLDETSGTSLDDHPHADIRGGEWFLSQVYQAVRNSPNWDRTVMLINYDEWGGFYDHVVPPKVVDTTVRPASWGAHPDYRQLGFRVPNVVISPFSRKGAIVHNDGRGPFEHTSALKMIEWRWGLEPLTDRDKNARNLAEMLDFKLARTDVPAIPTQALPPPMVCSVNGAASHRPDPIPAGDDGSGHGDKPGGGHSEGTLGASNPLPDTSAPSGAIPALASVAGLAGAAAAAARLRRSEPSG
ncbi:MAG TPA: alkaline phosphatase family protein [Candidatus Solibacter sp.]|jgi:phospholipase C|nr:alkaline phosphatase family protein [Candidatus Solibacter sp.]